MMTCCTKEALTPCQKPPDNPNTSSDANRDTSHSDNANTNTNSSTSKSKSLTSNGETQYYIDPKDGKYKVVPEDPNQLPADTTFLAVDDKGNLVQTDVNGIPSGSQAMTEKDKADKDLARAKLQVKNDIADGAAKNIKAANELVNQQFDANEKHSDLLTSAQDIQSSTEQIIADQQQRVAFQQGNMSNMIYELRLSTNEAEQAATILKRAAKTAMAKAAALAGPAPGPAPSVYRRPAPSPAPSATTPGPGPGPGPTKTTATDINVCRSDELYGACSKEILDPSGNYVATMRDDGDFVITTIADKATTDVTKYIFSTDTQLKGTPPYRMYLLEDGNLVLYDADNTRLWMSGTTKSDTNNAPYKTMLGTDGKLSTFDVNGNVVWSTNLTKLQRQYCKSSVLGGLCSNITKSLSGAKVILQDDGDLVFISAKQVKESISKTAGKGRPMHSFYLTNDGRIVIYDADNTVIWSSPADVSTPKPPYAAIVYDMGLSVVNVNNNQIWNSQVGSIKDNKAVSS